jgi:hypothetical protein
VATVPQSSDIHAGQRDDAALKAVDVFSTGVGKPRLPSPSAPLRLETAGIPHVVKTSHVLRLTSCGNQSIQKKALFVTKFMVQIGA